ncbi:MAG: AI-2E family transporter [Betaproteobacteria bacterium]|jgi:predicted PurR-regulated permease PerM
MSTGFSVRFAWYVLAAIAAGSLLYLVAPVLTPFLLSAVLAYICLPPVDRLARRLPRWLAAALVMTLLVVGLAALALIVAPMVERQFVAFLGHTPEYLDWARAQVVPWLSGTFGVELNLDMDHLRRAITENLRGDRDFFKALLPRITSGGMAIVGFFTAVLLMPVVLFYFLRDWHEIAHRIDDLIPRRLHAGARNIASEIDRVLGEFLRGQLLVMVLMAAYYVAALWVAGLEYALPIGILSGLLVFVPYLGMLVGLLLGTLAGFNQFNDVMGLVGVWVAFGVGQLLEGTLITPMLVGNRIGLHPVAVIFALLIFGKLFGFFGVLLALPASAALLVALRHLRAHYVASDLYKS